MMIGTTDLPQAFRKKTSIHPGRMERVMIQALEEVLGHAGAAGLLVHVGSPSGNGREDQAVEGELKIALKNISHLQAGLERTYGTRAGRGLALRIGRSCFKYGLVEFAPELGLFDLSFRLQPQQAKLKSSNEAFVALFNALTGQQAVLQMEEKTILWRIERCPLCRGRHAGTLGCNLLVGWLQEAMYWVSGGKYFEVRETNCIACGDEACVIRINRIPMV